MPLKPHDWNVVAIGRWNPAILTPTGIKRHLFGLKGKEEVSIEVPLDAVAPLKIGYRGLVVTVTLSRLSVEIEEPSLENLDAGRRLLKTAMEALPITPVTAVGCNVRFLGENSELGELFTVESVMAPWDDRLSELGLPVFRREMFRRMKLDSGAVTINIGFEGDQAFLGFNFEQTGSRDNLLKWLDTPMSTFTKIMNSVCREEISIG